MSAATSSLNGKVDDLRITVTPAATTIELPTDALFAFDSAAIEPGAAARLERTARIIAAAPAKAEIHVVGYTDAKGDDAYNLALSSRRADAVATWLQARPDLSGRQFTPVAKGEQDPVAPNTKADGSDNPEGRQRNRRVTVIVPR